MMCHVLISPWAMVEVSALENTTLLKFINRIVGACLQKQHTQLQKQVRNFCH
jgi:hypothetical protein